MFRINFHDAVKRLADGIDAEGLFALTVCRYRIDEPIFLDIRKVKAVYRVHHPEFIGSVPLFRYYALYCIRKPSEAVRSKVRFCGFV